MIMRLALCKKEYFIWIRTQILAFGSCDRSEQNDDNSTADPGLYGLYVRSMREDFGRDFRRWESALPLS